MKGRWLIVTILSLTGCSSSSGPDSNGTNVEQESVTCEELCEGWAGCYVLTSSERADCMAWCEDTPEDCARIKSAYAGCFMRELKTQDACFIIDDQLEAPIQGCDSTLEAVLSCEKQPTMATWCVHECAEISVGCDPTLCEGECFYAVKSCLDSDRFTLSVGTCGGWIDTSQTCM